jgi:uncharacterized membrane protein YdjX (TVP38/TMEM64 family)
MTFIQSGQDSVGSIMNHSFKKILLVIWASVVVSSVILYASSGLTLNELVVMIREYLASYGVWGPLIYIIVYSFRSLVFFPGSLLAVLSALLFGPLNGFLFTLVGENISANISFVIGRYFGSSLMKFLGTKSKVIQSIECKFIENGFLAVLTMRLMFLPFDMVGYLSGVCQIRQREFALGTFIGTIPGLATFILLGSSITDPRNLILALIFFVFGWVLSRCLKERQSVIDLIRPKISPDAP